MKVHKSKRKGFNSLVILGAWSIWKHRNGCVFEGASPCVDQVLQCFKEEKYLWNLAGARGLSSHGLGQVDEIP